MIVKPLKTTKKTSNGLKSQNVSPKRIPLPKKLNEAPQRPSTKIIFPSPRSEITTGSPIISSRPILERNSPEMRSFTSESCIRPSNGKQASMTKLKEIDKKTQESVDKKMNALHKTVSPFLGKPISLIKREQLEYKYQRESMKQAVLSSYFNAVLWPIKSEKVPNCSICC
jgi:hypothetical protein